MIKFKPQGGLKPDPRNGEGIQNTGCGELDDKWLVLRALAGSTTAGAETRMNWAAIDNENEAGILNVSSVTAITLVAEIAGISGSNIQIYPKFTDRDFAVTNDFEYAIPVGAAVATNTKPMDLRVIRPRFDANGKYIYILPIPACKYMKMFYLSSNAAIDFALRCARGWQNYNLFSY